MKHLGEEDTGDRKDKPRGWGNDNGGISGRAKGLLAREDRFIQVGQEAWLSRWDCVGTRPWGALEDESSIMETTFGGR